MATASNSRVLRAIPLLIAVCLFSLTTQAQYVVDSGTTDYAGTNTYVFLPDQSTVVQTGGIAGVHETYPIQGQFQLKVDVNAKVAGFGYVDAFLLSPVSSSPPQSLGELFNMTTLVGAVPDDTTISFTGKADDGSDVFITVTIEDDLAYLVGETIPPPNTADFFLFSLDAVAQRKYGGGTGEPNEPYRIATAEDLMLLGENPEDYDKHFVLTADIDLNPNLPGRKVFEKAVIAPDVDPTDENSWYQGHPFAGVFDGNGHTIFHLTIKGKDYLGLFGKLGPGHFWQLGTGTKIANLCMEAVDVNGTGDYVGGLLGNNYSGSIDNSYSIGIVTGDNYVGGLVGDNGGSISTSYSISIVRGNERVGGLVGINSWKSSITNSYSTGTANGDWPVGGLAGTNDGSVSNCYSTVTVVGGNEVGGLVGWNSRSGSINESYSTGEVVGGRDVGGLLGFNDGGRISMSYSTSAVSGEVCVSGLVSYNAGSIASCYSTGTVNGSLWDIGGLVGQNFGSITMSYCTGTVTGSNDNGNEQVGGLVGCNEINGSVIACYSTSTVSGADDVGGLVGNNIGTVTDCYSTGSVSGYWWWIGGLVGKNEGSITTSFWDIVTSEQTVSAGGMGLTTSEMKDPNTFMAVGWDFIVKPDGPHDIWAESETGGYPVLCWQVPPDFGLPCFADGKGKPNDPYLISKAAELNSIGYNPRLMNSHFKLLHDLDLTDIRFNAIGNPSYSPYYGTFDGDSHTISHLMIGGDDYVGVFSILGVGAEVNNLGVVDVNICGSGDYVGGLVGANSGGTVTGCHSTGTVTGNGWVGGLVGVNWPGGSVNSSYSTNTVRGSNSVGGLVGYNWDGITISYSASRVIGETSTGGLVGHNPTGEVTSCYSTGTITGNKQVGGLVGYNDYGSITFSYSTGRIEGNEQVGGLMGGNLYGDVNYCFWDVETSGQATSDGGAGKTTDEMQMGSTFLEAGWDFVDETANGEEDIWWINEGQDYPRLWWESVPEN